MALVVVAIPLVARADGDARAWLARSFARTPRAELLRSAGGRIEWTGILGDRAFKLPTLTIRIAWDLARHHVFAGDDDGMVRVLDADTGLEITAFKAHDGAVTALALAADRGSLLSGGEDGRVREWSTTTFERIAEYPGHTGPIVSIQSTRASDVVAVSAKGTARIWKRGSARSRLLPTGAKGKLLPHGLDLARGRGYLAGHLCVRQWDTVAGKEMVESEYTPDSEIQDLLATPNGELVVAVEGKRICVLDTKALREIAARDVEPVSGAMLHPDGARLLTWADGEIDVWTLSPLERVLTISVPVDSITDLALDSTGHTLMIAYDYGILPWSLQRGELRGPKDPSPVRRVIARGPHLVASYEWLPSLDVYDPSSLKRLRRIDPPRQRDIDAFAPVQDQIAWLLDDFTLGLSASPRTVQLEKADWSNLAAGADGVVTGDSKGRIAVWSVPQLTRTFIHRAEVPICYLDAAANRIAYSGPAERGWRIGLVSVSPPAARHVDLAGDDLVHVRLAPSGVCFSGGDRGRLCAWTPDGTRLWCRELGARIDGIGVTATTLATVSHDQRLRLWDHHGTLLDSIEIDGLPTSIALTPDRVHVGCENSLIYCYSYRAR